MCQLGNFSQKDSALCSLISRSVSQKKKLIIMILIIIITYKILNENSTSIQIIMFWSGAVKTLVYAQLTCLEIKPLSDYKKTS